MTGSTRPSSFRRRLPRRGLFPPLPSFVEQHLESASPTEACLIDLRPDDQGFVIPIGGEHPADWLAGMRAPMDSIGLAALAPARVVADRGVAGHQLSLGRTVHATAVVLADGQRLSRLALSDGSMVGSQPASGLLIDALARSLGLPTAPADLDSSWYWGVIWLGELIGVATAAHGDARSSMGAVEAAAHHPAIELDEVLDLRPAAVRAFCRDRHRTHARIVDWEGIRRATVALPLDVGLCSPMVAAWHDAGSFSRWLASELPEPRLIFELVAPALDADARQLVLSVLGPVLTAGPEPGSL